MRRLHFSPARSLSSSLGLVLVFGVGSIGCGPREDLGSGAQIQAPTEVEPEVEPEPDIDSDSGAEGAVADEPAQASAPRAFIDDPAVLQALEADGLSFAALLHASPDAQATADYGPGPLAAIRDSVEKTVAANRKADPEHTGIGLRYVHRQFDPTWLDAPDTRFELIAVVNRMDRHAFADAGEGEPGSMGETRLIYRLAYARTQRGVAVDSRLPMTINVVFWQPPAEDFAAGLRAWELDGDEGEPLEGAELAAALRGEGGPLNPTALDRGALEAVEINVQTERWPATIRPDMAGHAEYLLQVFHRAPEHRLGWRAAALENTPDVERLRRRGSEREALLAWLLAPEQRAGLDEGTLTVPERFRAKAATSVTPRGFGRVANRPFSELFGPEDFADYDFEGLSRVRSPRAALRRLDGMSCHGCHESRSIAGFHSLGVERDPQKRIDALAVARSPHLEGELERRRAWFEAVLAGGAVSEAREFSEHEPGRGGWGSHCGLSGAQGDPGFIDWTCDPGLECRDLGEGELGTCLEVGESGVGGVCEVGKVRSRSDHHKDRVRRLPDEEQPRCVSGAVCNDNGVGFPDGMCAGSCAGVDASTDDAAACGVIPNLIAFNNCLAAKRPFATCIVETVNPAAMRACSAKAPCRDDYICARTPEDEGGACLPPYFLFQLRVDGHPR